MPGFPLLSLWAEISKTHRKLQIRGPDLQVTSRLALAAVQTGSGDALDDMIGSPRRGRVRRGLHLEDIRVGYSDILAEEKVNAIATHWLSPTPLLIESLMLVGKFPVYHAISTAFQL